MSCNYCKQAPIQHSLHYKISNVKERFIPTYVHSQIFVPQSQSVNVRCTPTFHSTALDVQGYQTGANTKPLSTAEQEKTVYQNQTKTRRQNDLNPGVSYPCYLDCGSWYDPGKQDLFNSLKNCPIRSSRQRKFADLSSNPVFGGVVMEPYPALSTTLQEQRKETKVPSNKKDTLKCQQKTIQVHQQPENIQKESQNKPSSLKVQQEVLPNNQQKIVSKEQVKEATTKKVQSFQKVDKSKEEKFQSIQKVNKSKKVGKRPESSQRYVLSQDVTLCSRGCSAGRKIAKTMLVGSEDPAFTVFRAKKV